MCGRRHPLAACGDPPGGAAGIPLAGRAAFPWRAAGQASGSGLATAVPADSLCRCCGTFRRSDSARRGDVRRCDWCTAIWHGRRRLRMSLELPPQPEPANGARLSVRPARQICRTGRQSYARPAADWMNRQQAVSVRQPSSRAPGQVSRDRESRGAWQRPSPPQRWAPPRPPELPPSQPEPIRLH